ncbi:hypothetical protein HYH03_014724 [Edaphochlamys debaryana]|uniref:Uncharacterized protein n=1 Tax=Edaphochlamys debaryana TaxID=47281 RepID=A0A836BTB3_9CHLO|nr:hypothetical protein HYH03_014724 [Edaphochlamys debaryana]|eukprot:KAG2486669.1 hypothetical protein HYH03_014724 [Edaphochlamys debaryana]
MLNPQLPILATLSYGDGLTRQYQAVPYGISTDSYGRSVFLLDRAVGSAYSDSSPDASTGRRYAAPGNVTLTCVAQDDAGSSAEGTLADMYVYPSPPRVARGGQLALLPASPSDPAGVVYVDGDRPPATLSVSTLDLNGPSPATWQVHQVTATLTIQKLWPSDADPEEVSSWVEWRSLTAAFRRTSTISWVLADPSTSPWTFKFNFPGLYRLTWLVPDVEFPYSGRPYASSGPIEITAVAADPSFVEPGAPLPPSPPPPPPPPSPLPPRSPREWWWAWPPPMEEGGWAESPGPPPLEPPPPALPDTPPPARPVFPSPRAPKPPRPQQPTQPQRPPRLPPPPRPPRPPPPPPPQPPVPPAPPPSPPQPPLAPNLPPYPPGAPGMTYPPSYPPRYPLDPFAAPRKPSYPAPDAPEPPPSPEDTRPNTHPDM